MNIACFFPGCKNPVIGQCTGYQGNCGHFYCATHSKEKLCIECTQRRIMTEQGNQLLAKRKKQAENISILPVPLPLRGCVGILMTLIAIQVIIGGLVGVVALGHRDPAQGVGAFVLMLVILLVLKLAANRRINSQVTAIAANDPGFRDYYAEYSKAGRKSRNQMAMGMGGALLTGLFAALASDYEEARKKEQIRDAVDEALRKRDR